MNKLLIGGHEFSSQLFVGTGKFSSYSVMRDAIIASGTQLVTVALKRVDLAQSTDEMLDFLDMEQVVIMPNTSGARTADQAVLAAKLGREALSTDWVKLEIHPDPKYLLPDPIETMRAAELLVKEGFIVLPYVSADPVLCKRLEEAGTAAVMPLGAPIGSNRGLETREMLKIIIEQSNLPVVIDAGIGAPSHAAEAIELGADAVLVNTAIAAAADPVKMASAFKLAVQAAMIGRDAELPAVQECANASSPLTSFLQH